ncbi:SDR family oxidoreductase [Propioniciclava soli]|uniref:SDR family oxidoreductase n=1 Tax=Propioniciclava soli TaxID=2775081 RepID=UPI001E4696EE|nr:SDR family oxidoreductase [Propioniciclava soli]
MTISTVLLVGGTGSIGRLVAQQAVDAGLRVRAVVRDAERAARTLPDAVELLVGDPGDPATAAAAVEGMDAVVFTHGTHASAAEVERVDYGFVRSVLDAARGRDIRIALMTAIGVTVHDSPYNRQLGSHDQKRRAERLVRRSGHPYTVVRPGWFDYNDADERHLVFLQGDGRRAGDSSDGVIARDQIARVLLAGLTADAERLTLELVAERGPEQDDLAPLFAALTPDAADATDGALDPDTLPLADEPASVREDLAALSS